MALQPPRIQRLEESVVNRIAAGEIIQRPANALKELLENSLDAESTSITILVRDGGLKLLQIQDNGTGIRKADLDIVCERFTTSKLRKFEDLQTIATFGFRGEALASISHVAHLTITTKTRDEVCAWRASYRDGKLIAPRPGQSAEPKACAGNNGTQITVEDLFFNVPTRRNALKNTSDEYGRILDVVSRYSIHNSGVSFTCKKQGATNADLHTQPNGSIIDNIRTIYGPSIAKELLQLEMEYERLCFTAKGYITHANYHTKKTQFLLFINNRLVDCSPLKRGIEGVYQAYLPRSTYPFVYLALQIKPEHVDVNVHPTKKEVNFLDQEEVIACVCDAIQERLANANASRTFLTQTLLPGALPVLDIRPTESGQSQKVGKAREPDHKLVRTDSRTRTLHAFFPPPANKLDSPRIAVDGTVARTESRGEEVEHDIDERAETNKPHLIVPAKRKVDDQAAVGGQNTLERAQANPMTENDGQQRIGRAALTGVSMPQRVGIRDWSRQKQVLDTNAEEEQHHDDDDEAKRKKRRGKLPVYHNEAAVQADDDDAGLEDDGDVEMVFVDETENEAPAALKGVKPPRAYVEVRLTSVLELRDKVVKDENRDILREYVFVGCIDDVLALVQYKTKLFMVDYREMSCELFYQLGLKGFANFGFIRLSPPHSIFDLTMIALNDPDEDAMVLEDGLPNQESIRWGPDGTITPKAEIAQMVVDLLVDRREMLLEYFSITVTPSGELASLPILLASYTPNFGKLPLFLLRVASDVTWDTEKECFDTFIRNLATFYAFQATPLPPDSVRIEPEQTTGIVLKTTAGNVEVSRRVDDDDPGKRNWKVELDPEYRWSVEHVLFPALRTHLLAPRTLGDGGFVVQVADLPQLYKVFERC
ncbi:mismatch repair protein [Cladochytrium replicatum]|nr:mismatch repair protein [Cladochytrium replicatum]